MRGKNSWKRRLGGKQVNRCKIQLVCTSTTATTLQERWSSTGKVAQEKPDGSRGSLQEAELPSCSRRTEVVVMVRMGTPALLLLQSFVLRVGGSFSGFLLGVLVEVLFVCLF